MNKVLKIMFQKIKQIIPAPFKKIIKKILGREDVRNSDIIPYIKKSLRDDIVTVLDVGCGKLWEGNSKSEDILFSLFADLRYKITGIDIFEECISWRKENGPPGVYLTMDAKKLRDLSGKFDLVIAHHILEHMNKEESQNLLEEMERKALKQVIIGAPIGFTNTEYAVTSHRNPYERHFCAWFPEEFERRGYQVYKIKNVFLAFKNV